MAVPHGGMRELDERLGFSELAEQPAAAGPTLGGSEVAHTFNVSLRPEIWNEKGPQS